MAEIDDNLDTDEYQGTQDDKDTESKEAKITNGLPEPSDNSPCNLIAKYLPESMDEHGLQDLFAQFGDVVKCRLICDKATGKSKGYGFVKFANERQAEAATKALNGHGMEQKILRVNPANPAYQKHAAQPANVYVAGIPKSYTKQELFQMFSPYGSIMDHKVLVDKASGQSRGVGFVKFSNHESGNNAIQALNNTIPAGCDQPLIVRFAKVKPTMNMNMNVNPRNMFQMKMQNNLQSGYGPVRQNVGFNQGFNPMRDFQGQNQFGYQPYPQSLPNQLGNNFGGLTGMSAAPNMFGFGASNNEFGAGNNGFGQQQGLNEDAGLFIFHLPPNADEQQLFQLFSGFGVVANVKIIRDPQTQIGKGYGFVNMTTVMEAQAAVNSLNGFQMGGKYLKISFKKKK